MDVGETRAAQSPKEPELGDQVRALRKDLGISLAALSARTGLSRSTLYKVEKGQMSLTYENLIRLSRGLGVDISRLFELRNQSDEQGQAVTETKSFPGRRVIGRSSEGKALETDNYVDTYLCTELSKKLFDPVVTKVKARTLSEFGPFSRHPGEEFSFVLAGTVRVCSEAYEPVVLCAGDYIYFDSQMGHAYLNCGTEDAVLLTICSKRTVD
jgi:transcriptional regulator with XRE-family HTH domain